MAITFGSKPAEFKYVELPWEAIAAAGAAKQKRYDESDKVITDINENFLKIGSREDDTPRKQQLVNELQQEIYNVADTYSGDLGAALPKIKELQRKINYEMNYGELGAIKKNYDLEQARIKKIQESLDSYNEGKGGLDAYDAAALLAHDKKINKGPTQKIGSTWSTYKETPMYATQDYSKAAREIADKIDISTLEQFSGMKHIGNGIFLDEKTTTERRDQDIIEEYVTNALLADPKYAQYLDWKNTITGKKDNVLNVLQNQTVTTPDGVEYLPQMDAAGNEVGAVNPTAWANEYLTSDFRKAGRSAGEIFQRNKVTRDRKYATPDLGSGKEEAPALGLNVSATPIQNLDAFKRQSEQAKSNFGKVVDPKTGALNDEKGSNIGKNLSYGWAGLKAIWNMTAAALDIGISTMFNPVSGTPSKMQVDAMSAAAKQGQKTMEDFSKIHTQYNNPREGLTKTTEEMKNAYPSLGIVNSEMVEDSESFFKDRANTLGYTSIFWDESKAIADAKEDYFKQIESGRIKKTYDKASGTYKYPHEFAVEKYDKNAGVVFNSYAKALERASAQAGNIITLPEKNNKAIDAYVDRILPYGTLTTKNNPKNPELARQELVDENGQLKNIKFAGISDAASGGKLVFTINGKQAFFQPTDQITNSKLVVTQAISEVFLSQQPKIIPLSNGNVLKIQPDIVPSKGTTSFSSDGSNAEYMVRVEQYDANNKPVNFPGLQTNNIRGEDYYQLYELPSLLGALGVK